MPEAIETTTAMDEDPDGSLSIDVSDTQAHLRVDHAALASLARAVLRAQGVSRASISLTLVDDPTIHRINREHLEHDWPTDVITFPLSEPGDPELDAELVLSAEMAATTARHAGTDPDAELALYLVHGLLHLCGLDDRDDASSAQMRRREAELLEAAGLPHLFAAVERSAPRDGSPGS